MKNRDNDRATWQLPPGVHRGTWDYVSSDSIATEYDQFHGDHPLLRLDQEIIQQHLKDIPIDPAKPPVLIDLGCGTGRAILPWQARGWRTLGIDLSPSMLVEARAKASGSGDQRPPPGFIQANLAQLDFLQPDFADAAICLYSSIGMVQGSKNRISMMQNVARSLKKGGRFIVHVHSRGNWLLEVQGWRLIAQQVSKKLSEKGAEWGDRNYVYRGLPQMFLHIFSYGELLRELRQSGFKIEKVYALNRSSSGLLKWPKTFQSIRAGGLIAIATT